LKVQKQGVTDFEKINGGKRTWMGGWKIEASEQKKMNPEGKVQAQDRKQWGLKKGGDVRRIWNLPKKRD